MNQDAEHSRIIDARIARLRQRLRQMRTIDPDVRVILLGILDLLGDEL